MTKTTTVIRAYARLSVAREASQQIDQARHLIGKWVTYKHPEAEVAWYVDEGVSGDKPMAKRPHGGQLLRDLAKGDVLVVTKLDRLGRNTEDLLQTVRYVKDTGATFVATEQDISTDGPIGKFILTLLSATAEMERSIMSERQQAAREQLRRDGRHVGTLHYGFTTVEHPNGKGLAVRPHHEQGPLLREAIDAVLGGASIASQARRLGLSRTGLGKILQSERLIGRTPGNGPEVDEDARLIPTAKWVQLRAMFARDEPRSWTKTDGYGPALHCWKCEGRMYLDIHSRDGKGSYRCRTTGCKAATGIARETVDSQIDAMFLPGTPWGDLRVIRTEKVEDDQERAERLAVVDLGLGEAAEAMVRPGADVAHLAARVSELHLERQRIEDETPVTRKLVVDTGLSWAQWWAQATAHDRIGTLISTYRITIWPGKGPEKRNPRVEVDTL